MMSKESKLERSTYPLGVAGHGKKVNQQERPNIFCCNPHTVLDQVLRNCMQVHPFTHRQSEHAQGVAHGGAEVDGHWVCSEYKIEDRGDVHCPMCLQSYR